MRVILRLMALLAAVMFAGLSTAEAGSACAAASGVAPASAATRALWTIADVDGDRIDDLVRVETASVSPVTPRRAALPEIVTPRCGIEASTSDVARVLDGRLVARDLDADHDLDLVHLDAAGRPLRAWLNNGKGEFDAAASDLARWPVPSASYRHAAAPTQTRLHARHASRDFSLGIVQVRRLTEAPRPAPTSVVANTPLRTSSAWRPTGTRGPPSLSDN